MNMSNKTFRTSSIVNIYVVIREVEKSRPLVSDKPQVVWAKLDLDDRIDGHYEKGKDILSNCGKNPIP